MSRVTLHHTSATSVRRTGPNEPAVPKRMRDAWNKPRCVLKLGAKPSRPNLDQLLLGPFLPSLILLQVYLPSACPNKFSAPNCLRAWISLDQPKQRHMAAALSHCIWSGLSYSIIIAFSNQHIILQDSVVAVPW